MLLGQNAAKTSAFWEDPTRVQQPFWSSMKQLFQY